MKGPVERAERGENHEGRGEKRGTARSESQAMDDRRTRDTLTMLVIFQQIASDCTTVTLVSRIEGISERTALPKMSENACRRTDDIRLQERQASKQETWETRADHPVRGGRWRRNKSKARPKKRAMPLRVPSASVVQGGGKHKRCFWCVGFHGLTATAPGVS